MDHFEDYLQENDVFEDNEDPNTFEEFLGLEEYIYHGQLLTTDRIFNSKVELVDWAKETAVKVNIYLIINRYLKSRRSDHRLYVTLACERGGALRKTRNQELTMKKKKFQSKSGGLTRQKKM
ncbi:hypothetical protein M9H77_30875 [Catharanthus roseus]|uniref:Uncharacterized protein n=1 Tax=Catharanthus roseus TaxID=4058 RepID=A0ACC0A0S2_CATRO|nr:hypothetical protein M9H77_30875 [Catharanthus roseus]